MCLMQLFWINKSMNLYKYKPPPSALFQKPLFTKCILPMISEISAPNWCISATTSNIKSKISWICLARIPYLQIKVNHDNQQNNKYPRHFCSFINTQPSHHYKLTLEHHKFSIVITYPITKDYDLFFIDSEKSYSIVWQLQFIYVFVHQTESTKLLLSLWVVKH